jgi:RHS repeat-associated protein
LGRLVDYNGQVVFSYDGLDRVATRNTVPFSYVGTMLDPVTDGTFTYGRSPAGRLVSQTDGTTALLTGLDRHGDLTWLADTSGALTDTMMFDPFGDPTASSGQTNPTVGFQGDYTDPTSGEVWMGARWYSGGDAVFRSRDTIFGELHTPISLNRYTYAWANPNTYWDPDGHMVSPRPQLETYGSPEGARASTQTATSHKRRNLAKHKKQMPWEFGDSQLGMDAAAANQALFEDAGPTPDTASAEVVNVVFIGGVGTGYSTEKSGKNLEQLLEILGKAGVDANGYYTTWPSSKDSLVSYSGVVSAQNRMIDCHYSRFRPSTDCFYEDYAPRLAEELRSDYEDLPGTTILVAHSEGVVATSFAFAEDDRALTDVFDMVVLVNGAAAATGGYESYTEAGNPLVAVYDRHDPVVVNSERFIPLMGDLESTLYVDGIQSVDVTGSGHSGALTPNTWASDKLGSAIADRLTSTNSVIDFDPSKVWAPGRNFWYEGVLT